MKILHIVPSYKPAFVYGGPIESVSKLCEGLVAAGHQVDVLTTTANGASELDIAPGSTLDVDGVSVTYFKRITKDPTHVSPALWRHLYKHVRDYDIVNIQSWWNILVIVAACICHLKKVKVVVSPRGMLSTYIFASGSSKAKSMIHRLIGKRALQKSWFHATAPAEYEECKKIIPGWRGFVLPNLISLPKMPIEKAENTVFTLVFMSRIHPKKGIELLLKAMARVDFPVRLQIAGTGEEDYIGTLKTLAIELQLTNSIEWLGWINRSEKFNLLMKADLFTLVSLNENFANVVIEALHVGTPVLISKDVALSAFVAEQDLGWVSSLEVPDVVNQLQQARADHVKRQRIQAQGREVIAKYFAEQQLIQQYQKEYQSIIDTKNNMPWK